MKRRKTTTISIAAILLAINWLSLSSNATTPATYPIRQIDHIMIRADAPANLYALFTETLRLPVAWPLESRGGVTSGGVGFGNVNVEAIQFPGQKSSGAQLIGFGFEPAPLGECLTEFDRRGIKYGEVRPFISTEPDGSKRTLFTNVTLLQFSDSDRPRDATMHIFLSEYNPAYVDVEQRDERLHNELVRSGGGPLGVSAVKEIVIGASDFTVASSLWDRLLAPRHPVAPGLWQVGEGPAIRVVRAKENRLHGLIISVVSLRRAKIFLQEKGLLGPVSGREVTIDPSKIYGLNIRLVEETKAGA